MPVFTVHLLSMSVGKETEFQELARLKSNCPSQIMLRSKLPTPDYGQPFHDPLREGLPTTRPELRLRSGKNRRAAAVAEAELRNGRAHDSCFHRNTRVACLWLYRGGAGMGGEAELKSRTELLPGTLDLLLLKAVSLEPMHGYGIAQRLRQISRDVLQIEEGSLYPALQRLLNKGWILGEWKQTENNRRARYYKLTAAGRKQLKTEKEGFERLMSAIVRVMETV
jgi:PadR family transcriptional regulator PadR